MAQESRLVLSIDSRSAEQKAEDLAKALRALEQVGLRSADSTDAAGKSFAGAGKQASAAAGGVDRMNKSLSSTDKAADAAMSSLKRLFAAATAGIGAMSAIDSADSWGQYASRIRMATKSAEEYDHVQRRMVASANETYRSISETREGFIRMSPILRDMGLSLDQSIDAIDSFSGLLVINSASADRGSAAMAAYSKSLQKGKIDVDAWETISSTMPSLLKVISDSSGIAEEQIRKMGSEGKLSIGVLTKAFVDGSSQIKEGVAGMPATVRDALQNLSNSFQEIIGWQNEAKGVTAALASAISSLGTTMGGISAVYSGVLPEFAAANKLTKEQEQSILKAADAMKVMGAATGVYVGVTTAIKAATVAQAAFNVVARANPYIFIAASIAAATAAVYTFAGAQDRALDSAVNMWEQATKSTAGYDVAMARVSETQRLVTQLHTEQIGKEEQLQALRDKGFKKWGRDADTAKRLEKEIAEIQATRVRLSDLRVEAEKLEGERKKQALEEEKKLQAQLNSLLVGTASEADSAAKALAKFLAQSQLTTTSTNALSAAYLTSAEAVSKATREQKIEAEVLKLGEKSRAQVTKRINEMEDALEALDVAKTIADMRRQNVELGKYGQALLAGGTATKEGRKALADYNDEREIEAALVGKTSKEIDKLLPKLREEQRIRRERSDNNDALEQLNALVNETRTSQEKANDEIERMRDLYASAETPAHIEAIRRKIVEVQNETNIWAQATERAIDQVDQAGADFWETFLDGGKFSFSSLTDIAKKWAAEMLNMMTFKPLLTSFSNMLFGTNNSGGVGDVWGGLFGGSGNSGGGGFGNIVSLGKNIYSAYSTLTGVGAEVLAGYQSGGLSGAISGGAGYYGSMLSNAYSTVASWFGSTATSAATTAATSAATNAAANLGYGLGQNLVTGSLGSATGSATAAYAGATAGTAASSGWLSSLAGMATNPVGWVIAAITSGYQGQKLYNQGVRADASKIMGQTDNVAGQAFLWESAFNAKIHEWIDGAFRGIGIGGKALGWLGAGGSIHQSIWGPDGIIGKAIFGKQEQFKRTVGSAQGVYSGGEYTGTGAVEGWFGGSRRFGDDFDSALHDLNETFASSLGGLFDMFDIDSDIMTSAAGRLRRTSGRLAAEFTASFDDQVVTVMGQYGRKGNVQASMEQWFDDVMGRGLAQAIGASTLPKYLQELTAGLTKAEEVSGAVSGLFQRFDGVNAVFQAIGLSAYELSDLGLRSADAMLNLSAAIAGLEDPTAADKISSLNSLTSAYYQAFIPDDEKLAASLAALRSQFSALELSVPKSRAGFRAVVEGLDKTTEAGRQTLVSLLGLSEGMDEYYAAREALESSYYSAFTPALRQQQEAISSLLGEFSKLGIEMPTTRDGFVSLVDSIDTTSDAGDDLRRTLLGLSPALDSYISSLEDQKAALAQSQLSVSTGFDSLREQIFLDQLDTSQNKYGYYQSQANALRDLLPVLTSEKAIVDIQAEYARLTTAMYGQLDEFGKKASGSEIIESLDNFQSAAQAQLIKSQQEASAKELKAQEDMLTKFGSSFVSALERVLEGGTRNNEQFRQSLGSMTSTIVQTIDRLARGGAGNANR